MFRRKGIPIDYAVFIAANQLAKQSPKTPGAIIKCHGKLKPLYMPMARIEITYTKEKYLVKGQIIVEREGKTYPQSFRIIGTPRSEKSNLWLFICNSCKKKCKYFYYYSEPGLYCRKCLNLNFLSRLTQNDKGTYLALHLPELKNLIEKASTSRDREWALLGYFKWRREMMMKIRFLKKRIRRIYYVRHLEYKEKLNANRYFKQLEENNASQISSIPQ